MSQESSSPLLFSVSAHEAVSGGHALFWLGPEGEAFPQPPHMFSFRRHASCGEPLAWGRLQVASIRWQQHSSSDRPRHFEECRGGNP
jgi:hypothetical protein